MSYWSEIASSIRDDTAALAGSGTALRPWLADAGGFDGATVVPYPDQASLGVADSFTVVFWFRTSLFLGQQVLVESGGHFHGWAVLLSDSTLHFVWTNSSGEQAVSYDLMGRENQSIHVAARVSGQQMTLLIDGQAAGSATHPVSHSIEGTNDGSIGGCESDYRDHLGIEYYGGPGHYFTGQIDQLLTFDSALADAAVAELFAGPEPTCLTPPTATFNGDLVAWSPGVWQSHGNGVVSLFSDIYKDSVLVVADRITDPATGGDFDANALGQGLYEVVVKAVNDGGLSAPVYVAATDITPDPVPGISVAGLVGMPVSVLAQTQPSARAMAIAVANG